MIRSGRTISYPILIRKTKKLFVHLALVSDIMTGDNVTCHVESDALSPACFFLFDDGCARSISVRRIPVWREKQYLARWVLHPQY